MCCGRIATDGGGRGFLQLMGKRAKLCFGTGIPPAKRESEGPDLSQELKLSERSKGDEGSHRG